MSALGHRRRRRVGHGAALLLTMLPGSALAEAMARGDREAPSPARIEARVDDAFALIPQPKAVEPEPIRVAAMPPSTTFAPTRPSASPSVPPLSTPIAVAPSAPPPSSVPPMLGASAIGVDDLRPAVSQPAAGTGDEALGYAAGAGEPAGIAALERATAMPSIPRTATVDKVAVAVPLPKRRPEPPKAAAETAGEERAVGEVRVASLESDIEPAPRRAEPAPILAEDGVFGEPKIIPKEARPYLDLLRREAAANKVPLWLAIGVGWVESKYQPSLRGTHGVVGLMQVMPSTARFQGYKGPTEKLIEPETNIVWGMRELGWTWKVAKGDACLAIAKYKGGIATRSISQAARDYCAKARKVTGMS